MNHAAPETALSEVNPAAIACARLFENLAGGPLPRWRDFASHVHLRKIAAGGAVFDQDMEHPFVYVVREGLIRNVYFRENGEAWIKSFTQEGGFVASISALQSGGRSSFSAIAVEDCLLERIPFAVLERFAEEEIAWASLLRRAIMVFAARKEARERELLTLSPEENYRQFSRQNPDLERRLTQKDLAAYLGVTPVGLNRIVRRVNAARS